MPVQDEKTGKSALEVFRVDSHGVRIRRWMWEHSSAGDEFMHEPPRYLFGDMSADVARSGGLLKMKDRIAAIFPAGVPSVVIDALATLDAHVSEVNDQVARVVMLVDACLDPGVNAHDASPAGDGGSHN